MKPEQIKVIKFGVNYGIITGFISVLYTVILIAINQLYDQSLTKSLTGFILLIAPILIAIYNFKKLNHYTLTVGQAIGVGVTAAFVAAIITILFTLVLTNFVIPDFWDKSAEYKGVVLLKQNPTITPQQLNDHIAMNRKLAWITYPFILIFNIAIGFITSLLAGISLKTSEKL